MKLHGFLVGFTRFVCTILTHAAPERATLLPDNLPAVIDALFQTAGPLSQDLQLRMKISHKNNMRRRKWDPVR